MSGVKGRSGRRTHREDVEFYTLARCSVAHLLRRLRHPQTLAEIKDHIALDVVGRYISKIEVKDGIHQHNHVTYVWKDPDDPVLPATLPERDSLVAEPIPGGGDRTEGWEVDHGDQRID